MANFDIDAPERNDLAAAASFSVCLHRALHDAPLAHTILVDAALVVDGVQRPIEDRLELDRVRRRHLCHARRRHEIEVEPFIDKEAFVTRDEYRQVVDGVHDGDLVPPPGHAVYSAHIYLRLSPLMQPASNSLARSAPLLRDGSQISKSSNTHPRLYVAFKARYTLALHNGTPR